MSKKIKDKRVIGLVCKNCYGKGYSTELTTTTCWADFEGDKTIVSPMELKIHFCDCERGRELHDYFYTKMTKLLARMETCSTARACRHHLKDLILEL